MRVIVVCENKECFTVGKLREVGLQHLGQRVYMKGHLVCECGWDLRHVESV